MTDELKELNEEMLAHYQEGRYIVTVQEGQRNSDSETERWESVSANLYGCPGS